MHRLPRFRYPSQKGTYVTTDEVVLTHHNHTEPTVDVTLGVVHSRGLDKCIMTCYPFV